MNYCMACGISDCAARCDSCKKLPAGTPPFLCQPAMAEMGGLQLSTELLPSPPPSPPSFQQPSLLRSWLDSEGLADATRYQTGLRSASIIRKLTVAFAIAKLIRHLKDSVASYSQDELLHLCRVDNFSVQMSPDRTSEPGWEVLMEANMITPPMTLQVIKKPQGGSNFSTFASEKHIWGGDNIIDAIVSRHSSFCCAKEVASQDDTKNDSTICYALGVLLDCIFSGGSTMRTTVSSPENPQDTLNDFLRSLSVSPSQFASNDNKYESETRPTKCHRKIMHHKEEISMYLESSQVSRVVRDLLDCGQDRIRSDSTYLSLDTAIVDLHLLLLNPSGLVFEESHQLSPITTMHGRSSETSSLLSAYHRVASSGISEAFIVKGFSGSGKTTLVQSLSDVINRTNGLWVYKKFEENSTNQLAL
eukprot:scaffold67786_cov85-Cyclotella_meneghiniana.AAC.1